MAVLLYWQGQYDEALMPDASAETNLAVEKAVERLALVARDYPDAEAGAAQVQRQLAVLDRYGVTPDPAAAPAAR